MKMDLNYLKKLIKILDTSDLAELEIEEEGSRIKLTKPQANVTHSYAPMNMQQAQAAFPAMTNGSGSSSSSNETAETSGETEKKAVTSDNAFEVRSPMVGTFYRAPSPDADSYVKVGDMVSPGTVLCIIEAMKLMNEIECEVSGKVVQIVTENGQAVEYNQPLFIIEKS